MALEAVTPPLFFILLPKLQYILFENISLKQLEESFCAIQKCKPLLRKKIFEMSLYALNSDGKFKAKD
ncbi:MAG: hypothetical protein LBB59_04935, partial [Campylobacteraceae bacterium]|nr:hypothetical protein [Campylobacteraceae bacterium]